MKYPTVDPSPRSLLSQIAFNLLAAMVAIAPLAGPKASAASEPVKIYSRFQDSPISSVTPEGWLKEFLLRQKSGLTGHRAVLEYPFNTGLWNGPILPNHSPQAWWPYEQSAYLTDGLLRLGYLLRDDDLIKDGSAGVNYILAHPLPNGRLGFPFINNQWPLAVFFRALQADYLATGDERIIEALHRHYLSYSAAELANQDRNIVNIEGMLWTYGKTGDPELLELAEQSYAAFNAKKPQYVLNMQMCLSSSTVVTHGVTYMEESKLPAILYTYTGKQTYLDASVNALKKLDRDHMLPDGVPSTNEFLHGKDPLWSHETCDISDYSWSAGYLLQATGDATWADHIERAVFNAGLGAISNGLQELSIFFECQPGYRHGRIQSKCILPRLDVDGVLAVQRGGMLRRERKSFYAKSCRPHVDAYARGRPGRSPLRAFG